MPTLEERVTALENNYHDLFTWVVYFDANAWLNWTYYKDNHRRQGSVQGCYFYCNIRAANRRQIGYLPTEYPNVDSAETAAYYLNSQIKEEYEREH